MKFILTASSASPSVQEILSAGLSNLSLERLLGVVVIVVIGLLVIRLLLRALDRVLARLQEALAKLVRLAVKVVLLFLLVLIVMDYLEIPVTSLVALLSVASLAVSLAAQNFLSNVAGGLQLITSQPFQVGDYVEAGGCGGTVQEIGLFYTKLTTPDNKLIQLPNSTIVAANIINYSSEPTRRVDWSVKASYDSPTSLVVDTLRALILQSDKVLADPEPRVYVADYGPSAIEYTVRVWCAGEDYWDVYFGIVGGCKEAFDRAEIQMTYDHLNVHLVGASGQGDGAHA